MKKNLKQLKRFTRKKNRHELNRKKRRRIEQKKKYAYKNGFKIPLDSKEKIKIKEEIFENIKGGGEK